MDEFTLNLPSKVTRDRKLFFGNFTRNFLVGSTDIFDPKRIEL